MSGAEAGDLVFLIFLIVVVIGAFACMVHAAIGD